MEPAVVKPRAGCDRLSRGTISVVLALALIVQFSSRAAGISRVDESGGEVRISGSAVGTLIGNQIAIAFECDAVVVSDRKHVPDPLRIDLGCSIEGAGGVLATAPSQEVHLAPLASTGSIAMVPIEAVRVCVDVTVTFADGIKSRRDCFWPAASVGAD